MANNNNIKVGVTVTVFAGVLALLILWLSQFSPGKKGYVIEGLFTNIGGLLPGSKIYYMGVTVGTVKANILEADKVRVFLEINPDVKIPKRTKVNIGAKGLVGDKAVEFFPVKEGDDALKDRKPEQLKGFFKEGDTIEGISPASFEDVIIEAKKTLVKAQGLISDPELTASIKKTSKNVELFTASLGKSVKQIDVVADNITKISSVAGDFVTHTNELVEEIHAFTKDLRTTTESNKPTVEHIIKNAELISMSLERTVKNFNNIVEDPSNVKNTGDSINGVKNAIVNLQKISQSTATLVSNLDLISSDVRDLSGDTNMKSNFKNIIENLKILSESFANISKQATNQFLNQNNFGKSEKERLHLEFKSEILPKLKYQFIADAVPSFDLVGNFNILAHTGFESFPFLQLGVEEIGTMNQFNMQAGFYPFKNTRLRVGIVRGKLGGGANYFNEPTSTDIFLDGYDISSPHVRLGFMQNVYKDFGLTVSWDNQISTNINEFSLGIRWQPSIL